MDAFGKILNYLKITNTDNVISDFANGNIQIENIKFWETIKTAYEHKKKDFEIELEQIKQ